MSIEQSRTRSPYTEVALDFSITNDTSQSRLVYFRADEVPPQWSQRFAADSALLGSGQRYIGKLTVKPNDEAPACRNQEIFVTGWTPRGDTLVQLGGTTLNVALRKTATIDVSTSASSCSIDSEYGTVGRRYCQRVVAKGCTDPAQPNQTVSIRYTDAAGQPVWREVQTDATGCFEDSYVARTGGPLKVTAYHPGDACNSSATHTTTIGLPPSDDWGGERRREWGIFVEYLHLERKLGIRSPWMLGARYALQLNASWFIESELSFGASKSMAGATGRVWQLTAHSIYQTQPFGTLGWRAFALGGAGVIAFDGFAGSAKSSTLDLGIGLKVPLSPRVNLRGDIRLVRGSSVYGAGAFRNVEATLGVSAKF